MIGSPGRVFKKYTQKLKTEKNFVYVFVIHLEYLLYRFILFAKKSLCQYTEISLM